MSLASATPGSLMTFARFFRSTMRAEAWEFRSLVGGGGGVGEGNGARKCEYR